MSIISELWLYVIIYEYKILNKVVMERGYKNNYYFQQNFIIMLIESLTFNYCYANNKMYRVIFKLDI